jgi:23S rRNA G2445 N2-methylase RlmL
LEEIGHCQQDDGPRQCQQNGLPGDGSVDRTDMEDGAEESTGQECADDCHNDVDQQVLAVMYDLSGHPADHRGYDQVNNYVHFLPKIDVKPSALAVGSSQS